MDASAFIYLKQSMELFHLDVEPKIGGFYPQNGWFIMENPIKMDDLGVTLFLEAHIFPFSSIFTTKLHEDMLHFILSWLSP